MKQEEIVKNIEDLNNNYESLEALFDVFKSSIEKQIDWFYAILAIMIAVLLVALFFLVKSMVQTGIEKGINQATSTVQKEISDLRSQIKSLKETQEEKIIAILKDNPQIKWATGTITSYGIDRKGSDGTVEMPFFQKEIDWTSPLNSFEIKLNGSTVNYQIIKKYPEGMDILIYDVPDDFVEYEWKFIWATK